MRIEPVTLEQCLDLRRQVLWPDMPGESVRLGSDETARHYGLYVQQHLVSCVSLFMTSEDMWEIKKFATLQDYQSMGYGTQLLREMLSLADNAGIDKVCLKSRTTAIRFYQKSGFQIYSEPFMRDGVEFIRMQRYTDLSLQ